MECGVLPNILPSILVTPPQASPIPVHLLDNCAELHLPCIPFSSLLYSVLLLFIIPLIGNAISPWGRTMFYSLSNDDAHKNSINDPTAKCCQYSNYPNRHESIEPYTPLMQTNAILLIFALSPETLPLLHLQLSSSSTLTMGQIKSLPLVLLRHCTSI